MTLSLILLFTLAPQAAVYDSTSLYANPLEGLDAACSAHAELYQVYRPIMPFVMHTFIGAVTHVTCAGTPEREVHSVFGASKGASDLAVFEAELQSPSDNLERLGSVSGADAYTVLESARAVSLDWQSWLANPVYFPVRMVATPLLGRPCADAAAEVRYGVRGLLH